MESRRAPSLTVGLFRLSLMLCDHCRQVFGHRGIQVVKSLLLLLSFPELARNQIADCEVVGERSVIQLDYVPTFFNGKRLDNIRASAGIKIK
jgi:hypothetical protein